MADRMVDRSVIRKVVRRGCNFCSSDENGSAFQSLEGANVRG